MTSQIKLTWNDYSADESGYNIYRDTSPIVATSLPAPLATGVAANSTSYTDTTAVDGTTYYYAVAAANDNVVQSKWVSTYGPVVAAPSWKPAGVDVYVDFKNNQFWDKVEKTLDDWLRDWHDTASLIENASGDWASKAANTVCREAGVGLQTAPGRTNEIRNNSNVGAVVGAPGTQPTGWSISTSAGISREIVAVGTEKGLPYIDIRLYGTTTGAFSMNPAPVGASVITTAVGETWSASFYFKVIAGSMAGFTAFNFVSTQHNAAAGFLTTVAPSVVLLGAVSGGPLTRYTAVGVANHASVVYVHTSISCTANVGANIDVTFRCVGWQMERGPYASPPILTTGAATTRFTNVPFINATEHELAAGVVGFVKFKTKVPITAVDTSTPKVVMFSNDSGGSPSYVYRDTASNVGRYNVFGTGGLFVNSGYVVPVDTVVTIVFAFGPNYANVRVVGQAAPAADTSGTWTEPTKVYFGTSVGGATNPWHIIEKFAYKAVQPTQAEFDAMYTIAAAA